MTATEWTYFDWGIFTDIFRQKIIDMSTWLATLRRTFTFNTTQPKADWIKTDTFEVRFVYRFMRYLTDVTCVHWRLVAPNRISPSRRSMGQMKEWLNPINSRAICLYLFNSFCSPPHFRSKQNRFIVSVSYYSDSDYSDGNCRHGCPVLFAEMCCFDCRHCHLGDGLVVDCSFGCVHPSSLDDCATWFVHPLWPYRSLRPECADIWWCCRGYSIRAYAKICHRPSMCKWLRANLCSSMCRSWPNVHCMFRRSSARPTVHFSREKKIQGIN